MGVSIVLTEKYIDQLMKIAGANPSAFIVDRTLRWALKKEIALLKNIYWINEQHFLWPTRISNTNLISLRFLIKRDVVGKDANGDPEILITLIAVSEREAHF